VVRDRLTVRGDGANAVQADARLVGRRSRRRGEEVGQLHVEREKLLQGLLARHLARREPVDAMLQLPREPRLDEGE